MKMNEAFPSNWLKSADIGEGAMVLTIDGARMEMIKGDKGDENKLILSFLEQEKELICNKTNANTIAGHYGEETDDWIGKRIALVVMDVQFGGKMMPGIRVSTRKPAPKVTPGKPIQRPTREPVPAPVGNQDAEEPSGDPADEEDIPF